MTTACPKALPTAAVTARQSGSTMVCPTARRSADPSAPRREGACACTTNSQCPGSCKGPDSHPPMPTPRSTTTRPATAARSSRCPGSARTRTKTPCTTRPEDNTASPTLRSPSPTPTARPCSHNSSRTPPRSETEARRCSRSPGCPPPKPPAPRSCPRPTSQEPAETEASVQRKGRPLDFRSADR